MTTRSLAFAAAILASTSAIAQTDLPAKMQGAWKSSVIEKSGSLDLVLVGMESADKAKVKVAVGGSIQGSADARPCNFGSVESVAERSDGVWTVSAPHRICASYVFRFQPVAGRQRFEGTFTNDSGGRGTVFLDY